MGRAVVQFSLFGLLLALVTTLPNKGDWDIYSFHINSTVSGRYATTVITSRVANRMDDSKEIEFHVRIPKNAFISNFRMFIDGEVYDGVVKAKDAAQKQYTEAVSQGQSAGIISSVGRTLEEFKTSVNVAAHKKVTFELTYEELLKRRLGKYELQIHARPMQPVRDFKVDVHIKENSGINFMEVKGGLSTQALANAITKTVADTQAWVYFYPTVDQQKTCDSCGADGMNGDLVIVYDVNRDSSLGDIQTSPGYFVHHFAPSNLVRIPKNVVFVIDQSGSMHGRKMQQTRIALLHILNDLAKDDFFGIITFDSSIFHWKKELVQANDANLESARAFAREIRDRGATNINLAVLEGARMLNANPREGSASILILLTDGDPTSGETNPERIQASVREAIAEKFPLYCLGFGFDVNFEFLEKMSLQNNGAARRIYEDSDADLQLKGFYEEVATPLLTDVTMVYEGGFNVTQTNFSQYYNGSEIVVAGQISNDVETFTPRVLAISRKTKLVFSNGTVDRAGPEQQNRIQRVWAYLTVKQLLDSELQLSGPAKDIAKKEALELSLKYNFVTPLTSMVVTKPPGESTDVLHKPQEGENPAGRIIPPPVLHSLPQPGLGPGYGGRSVLSGSSGPQHGLGMTNQMKRPAKNSVFLSKGFSPPMSVDYDEEIMDMSRISAGIVIPSSGVLPSPRGGISFDLSVVPILERPVSIPYIPPPPPPPPVHPPVPIHKFLLKTENQSLPLCYGFFGNVRLKLLHHSNRELSVNGEMNSGGRDVGFRKIVIHVAQTQITLDTLQTTVEDGQNISISTMKDEATTVGSLTVIRREGEIDVAGEDFRMIILIHSKNGRRFLWPVMRQMPTDTSVTGLLAQKPAVYEEVQQNPTKLRIHNEETEVSRVNAVDYSIASAPSLDCWFTSVKSALQKPLDEFLTSQL